MCERRYCPLLRIPATSAGGAEEGSQGQVRSAPPPELVQINYARTSNHSTSLREQAVEC